MKRWCLLPLVLLVTGCGYNRIQELDEQVEARQADIETELLRRNDLIPNLVATVDQAAAFERETFTEVARARAGLASAREQMASTLQGGAGGDDLSRASAAVSENLRLFLNVAVEAYPQLRANQNFIALQDELTETENRLAVRRQDYNETVRVYNTYIRQFPTVVTARVIGAQRRRPFEAPTAAEAPPRVEFGGGRN
jgi:LemA protein